MKKIIHSNEAPAAIGPYSQAIEAGGFVFLSGQLGIDPASGELVKGIDAQARRVLDNIRTILAAAGRSLADVVRTTIYLRDMHNFQKVNAVYAEYFPGDYPARSTVEVSHLPKDADVEIEVTALGAAR